METVGVVDELESAKSWTPMASGDVDWAPYAGSAPEQSATHAATMVRAPTRLLRTRSIPTRAPSVRERIDNLIKFLVPLPLGSNTPTIRIDSELPLYETISMFNVNWFRDLPVGVGNPCNNPINYAPNDGVSVPQRRLVAQEALSRGGRKKQYPVNGTPQTDEKR